MDRRKTETSISLKIWSEHRQVISSKFPSFRGAHDLVVLSEFLTVGKKTRKIMKIMKLHQVTSTPKTLRKLAWNHLGVLRLNLMEIEGSFLFYTVQALLISYIYYFWNLVVENSKKSKDAKLAELSKKFSIIFDKELIYCAEGIVVFDSASSQFR